MKKHEALDVISNFTDSTDMDFKQCSDGYSNLEKVIAEYPEYSSYVLSAVAFSSKLKVFCADLAPTASRVFIVAAQNVGDEDVSNCLKGLFDKNTTFALMCCKDLSVQRPHMAESFFEMLMSNVEEIDANKAYRYRTAAAEAIKNGDRAMKMLDEAMKSPKLAPVLYKSLGEIYKSRPETGELVLQLLGDKKHLTAENYTAFYGNLETIVLLNETPREDTVYTENYGDAEMAKRALSLMEEHIKDDANDANSLAAAYKAAGHIGQIMPEYKERVEALIHCGLEHKKNTKISQKTAYRVLGDFEKLCSRAEIYRRGDKTDDCPYGITAVSVPDDDKPCVLVLGGDGVRSEKLLNGYMSGVYRLLKDKNLHEAVNVYGIVYDFGEYTDVNYARSKMMEKHHRKIKLSREAPADTLEPRYVEDIFNRFLLPRVSNDGKKIDAKAAACNIRKLNIVAHCHGAYTALLLEEMMQKKMKELGYSAEECADIQKQLLVVAQSPYCPLGESKSTFVSFASARDMETNHYNNFERALDAIRREEKIPFSYFPDKKGNLFLADTMGKEKDEHNFWGFHYDDTTDKQGKALILLESKVLVNGVKNSLTPERGIPTTKDLVADDDDSRRLFEHAESNGQKLYNKMYAISMAVARYRAQQEK